ncbi:MAG: response regulator, partial [Deltaproteobacteria bacterium]|nr:response regulator [Deltaproteobacteria bacterium]
RQLLTFSRSRRLDKQQFDVGSLVSRLAPTIERLLGEQVRLQIRLAPEPLVVEADPSQMEQMLVNLAVNASDAMPEGGTLSIETARARSGAADAGSRPMVRIAVADTGVGMDEATRSKVFEPFFTTKEGEEHVGLGLSTAYGIVTQSQGTIAVQSAPGEGSRFEILLPAAGPEPAALGAVPAAAARGETVLLVEDSAGFRAVTAELLVELGYRVLEAAGAQQALDLAAGHDGPIHAVLVGVGGREGQAAALAARIVELRPAVAVVFMSGQVGERSVRAAWSGGEAGFVAKPFTPAELGGELRRLLGGG